MNPMEATTIQNTVIKYPLSSEKSVRLMESSNTLVFIVDKAATKPMIKTAIQDMFKTKVTRVATLISPKGFKKAYITFSPETPAIDIATKMGLM